MIGMNKSSNIVALKHQDYDGSFKIDLQNYRIRTPGSDHCIWLIGTNEYCEDQLYRFLMTAKQHSIQIVIAVVKRKIVRNCSTSWVADD